MKIHDLTNEKFLLEASTASAYRSAARGKLPSNGFTDAFKKLYFKIGKNQRRTDLLTKVWMAKWGGLTAFLKVIQVVGPAIELYCQLDFAQEMRDGKVPGHTLDAEEYKDLEEQLWGLFVLQELAPIAIRIARSVFLINWVLRIIKWVAGSVSATVTAGTTVALAVASEAFQIWLQYWITSDAGTKWLSESMLMPIVKGIGWGPAALSSLIKEWRASSEAKDAEKKDTEPTGTDSKPAGGASGQKDTSTDVDKTSKDPENTSGAKNTDPSKSGSGINYFKKDDSPEDLKRKEKEFQQSDSPWVKTTIDPKSGKLDVGMKARYN